MAVDARGNPLGFALSSGEAHDLKGADVLLPQIKAPIVIADKAYDADARMRIPLMSAGKTAVIPYKRHRSQPGEHDKTLYKKRHLIENFFAKIKQYRAIATRYGKTKQNFIAAIYLIAAVIRT